MNINASFNKRGITIIELLVGLVICAIVIAAIYRVFTVQSNAYVVQDQVVEVQQNIRSAMEIMVRDIRMAGFDYDNSTSPLRIEDFKPLPPYDVRGNSITIWYENYQAGPPLISQIHAVTYTLPLNNTNLERQLSVNGVVQPVEVILENVIALELTCGIDGRIGYEDTQDGVVDNWINCGAVNNSRDKVIAVRISLTTRPEQVNPQDDRFRTVSPRALTSIVALRNLSIKRF
ncbi:MAG: PilW family protein [Deltaproteobacteria bacterium]|nr:PilW family protein [Deltaproteobacteria bacterium]